MPTLNQTDLLRKQRRMNHKQPEIKGTMLSAKSLERINAKMMQERKRRASGFKTGHRVSQLDAPLLHKEGSYECQPGRVELDPRLTAEHEQIARTVAQARAEFQGSLSSRPQRLAPSRSSH